MFEIVKRNFWAYLFELILAVIIYHLSFGAFLVYIFFVILINIHTATDYLRKLMIVFQMMNEAKLVAIAKKLGIKEEEVNELLKNSLSKLTEEQKRGLNADLEDLGIYFAFGGNPLDDLDQDRT